MKEVTERANGVRNTAAPVADDQRNARALVTIPDRTRPVLVLKCSA